jgi:hypothetical protein
LYLAVDIYQRSRDTRNAIPNGRPAGHFSGTTNVEENDCAHLDQDDGEDSAADEEEADNMDDTLMDELGPEEELPAFEQARRPQQPNGKSISHWTRVKTRTVKLINAALVEIRSMLPISRGVKAEESRGKLITQAIAASKMPRALWNALQHMPYQPQAQVDFPSEYHVKNVLTPKLSWISP